MTALRPAQMHERLIAMDIIQHAKAFLRAQGIDQWQDSYPDEPCIEEDIQAKRGYFLTVDGEIAGYLCVDFGGEPAYNQISGTWLTQSAYGVVHRLAFFPAYHGKNLTAAAFEFAAQLCRSHGIYSLRADTDPRNQRMQRALKRSGFVSCGTVVFQGSPKIAFEKVL